MPTQTVTRAAESDSEPYGIYNVLADASNIPKWASALALLENVLAPFAGKRVDVFVVRTNRKARAFYEGMGFQELQEWCLYRIESHD
jgi:ribosomal protein S18 acetylase RimI-like enzyme